MSEQRFEARKKALRQRLEANPEDREALFDLGQTCMDDHDPTEALRWFREAWRLDFDNSRIANAMGDASFDLELYDDAATWYRQAATLDPRFAEAWLNLANALMELGRWEEAEGVLRRTIDLEAGFDEAFLYLGICQLRQNRPLEAKRTLLEALAREPEEFQTYVALSDCCLRLGDLEGAIKACEDALGYVVEMEELDILLESLRLAGLSPERAEAMRRQAENSPRRARSGGKGRARRVGG